MQLLSGLAVLAMGASALAAPYDPPVQGGFVPTIGPFSLRISSADSSLNRRYLTMVQGNNPADVPGVGLITNPDKSFYWVPNSARPAPPGPYMPWGTLIYEARFHTAAYNLTLDIATRSSADLVTPVVLHNDNFTAFATAAAYNKYSGVVFMNDTSEFLACVGGGYPYDYGYTLNWRSNFEPGWEGTVMHRCSPVIVSIDGISTRTWADVARKVLNWISPPTASRRNESYVQ